MPADDTSRHESTQRRILQLVGASGVAATAGIAGESAAAATGVDALASPIDDLDEVELAEP